MNSLSSIKEEILKAKKIAMSFHTSPDGDAVGSTLALLNAFKILKINAYVISRDVIPDNLSFLPLSETIEYENTKPTSDTDLVIIMDCGNADRISADLSGYSGKIINIDHHLSNEMYGHLNYVESDSAAASELSYLIIKELGIEFDNSQEKLNVCKCIYTGIVTDTGSFRHSNVTERTHKIVSELIKCGINNAEIHSLLFDNKPYEKIKLIGAVLSNLKLELNEKAAVLKVTKQALEQLNLVKCDTSDVINMGLGIKGVEAALFLKEVDEGVKLSLRSKNNVDVRKVAEVFGGGGHTKAAGGMIKDISLECAEKEVLKELRKELDDKNLL